MLTKNKFLRLVLLCTLPFLLTSLHAKKGFGNKAEDRKMKMEKASGLTPVFYNNASCNDIDSEYGSKTRYDGSQRPKNRNKGHHGGTDWTITIGEPLLAIADGKVIHKGKGGRMEGKYIWLLHSPKQTGMPHWTYSKYQHLDKIPDIEVGTNVKVGEVIAIGGDTGTKGGHYGNHGYPHLHLSIKKTREPNYEISWGKLRAKKAKGTDVLYLYNNTIHTPKLFENIKTQPNEVLVGYVKNGKITPQDAKLIWPIACQ